MTEDWRNGGFGLYVHWPFCESKCPYCDFNSHVTKNVDQKRWANALAQEVRRVGALTEGRVLGSIFFGGGTPSLMKVETVSTILEATRDVWHWANDIEISLEANPRSVEAQRFEGYAKAGVNRVSLGVQSLRDADLAQLGRLHSAREATDAFAVARDVFDRVSFDLIYARQGQTLDDWRSELTEALNMAVDHLSLYQLTIEQGTAFWDRARRGGLIGLPDEDLAADMYEMTTEITEAAGFEGYEVSNHARSGAMSQHNLVYWRYGDYAGVGPGAHGRLTLNGQRMASAGWLAPGKWLEAAQNGCGEEVWNTLSIQDTVSEHLMMGLRLVEGIDLDRVSLRHVAQDRISSLCDLGMVWESGRRIGATVKGRLVLNAVISELMPDLA